jgi:hypothetical protein
LHVEEAEILEEDGEFDEGGAGAVGYVGGPDVLMKCELRNPWFRLSSYLL